MLVVQAIGEHGTETAMKIRLLTKYGGTLIAYVFLAFPIE
jgi:hypothetical protein